MMHKGLIPEPEFRTSTLASPMDQLIEGERRNRYAEMYPADSVWLLGLRIPPFQRRLCWTQAQKTAFIENAWQGFHLGNYVVNRNDDTTRDGRFHHTDLWLIDGQQRLSTIAEYVADGFAVFGHLWSELTDIDRRRFGNLPFAQSRLNLKSEADLRRVYNALNFGGTAHAAHERA